VAVKADINLFTHGVKADIVPSVSIYSNKIFRAVFSCGAVYYAVQGGANFKFCGLKENESTHERS